MAPRAGGGRRGGAPRAAPGRARAGRLRPPPARPARARASPRLPRPRGGWGRGPGDTGLVAAVSMCFALGAATIEQFKHLAAAEAGPLAGLPALPGLRALRPQLAAIADGTDPLDLQRLFASAMLAADPVTSGVSYVADHFVPHTGAKPVGKGWNNKRGKAEK